jgi:hypothetical protein
MKTKGYDDLLHLNEDSYLNDNFIEGLDYGYGESFDKGGQRAAGSNTKNSGVVQPTITQSFEKEHNKVVE